MLWLLSQMCVRFFKSIDSGWINGNPGIFFPCAKRELITLFSEACCRGVKGKCSEGLHSPLPREKDQEPASCLAVIRVMVTS